MANNEFNNIDQFIEGFTKSKHFEGESYDGIINGIEFLYKGNYYRITKDPIGNEEELKRYFNNYKGEAKIKFMIFPKDTYSLANLIPISSYLGLYENVDDLINLGKIDGKTLKEILISEETEITGLE